MAEVRISGRPKILTWWYMAIDSSSCSSTNIQQRCVALSTSPLRYSACGAHTGHHPLSFTRTVEPYACPGHLCVFEFAATLKAYFAPRDPHGGMVARFTDGSGPYHLSDWLTITITHNAVDANQRLTGPIMQHSRFKLNIHRVMLRGDRRPWILQQCRSPTSLEALGRDSRIELGSDLFC